MATIINRKHVAQPHLLGKKPAAASTGGPNLEVVPNRRLVFEEETEGRKLIRVLLKVKATLMSVPIAKVGEIIGAGCADEIPEQDERGVAFHGIQIFNAVSLAQNGAFDCGLSPFHASRYTASAIGQHLNHSLLVRHRIFRPS
jgi:hypothetical protein